MKQLLLVLAFVACSCQRGPAHPLASVAERLPAVLACPATDGTEATRAVGEVIADPKSAWDKYTEQAKTKPVEVACLQRRWS